MDSMFLQSCDLRKANSFDIMSSLWSINSSSSYWTSEPAEGDSQHASDTIYMGVKLLIILPDLVWIQNEEETFSPVVSGEPRMVSAAH